MKYALRGLAIVAVVVIAWVEWPARQPRATGDDASLEFKNYHPLAEAIRKLTTVTLLEGLPHQYFEKEELARELKKQRTVKLHGFPFYEERLPLSLEDGKRLTELFCDGKSIQKSLYLPEHERRKTNPDGSVTLHEVSKACGGYHPDYCIEWHSDVGVYRMLVCFGCGEAKIYGPKHSLYCDLDSCGDSVWQSVLEKYQKNRPRPWTFDFNTQKTLADHIRRATNVVLYEGIPNVHVESQLSASEMRTKDTIELNGFYFYPSPLSLSPEDGKRLTDLFCDGKSLREHDAFVKWKERKRFASDEGAAKTSWFHPDYCIEWKHEGTVCRMLIGLGCGEAKIYGLKQMLICDLDRRIDSEWHSVLSKYQKNRPRQ
jgi:hypothetical protein